MSDKGDKNPWHKPVFYLAITLHNIPKGLAVWVLFGGATIEGAFALVLESGCKFPLRFGGCYAFTKTGNKQLVIFLIWPIFCGRRFCRYCFWCLGSFIYLTCPAFSLSLAAGAIIFWQWKKWFLNLSRIIIQILLFKF